MLISPKPCSSFCVEISLIPFGTTLQPLIIRSKHKDKWCLHSFQVTFVGLVLTIVGPPMTTVNQAIDSQTHPQAKLMEIVPQFSFLLPRWLCFGSRWQLKLRRTALSVLSFIFIQIPFPHCDLDLEWVVSKNSQALSTHEGSLHFQFSFWSYTLFTRRNDAALRYSLTPIGLLSLGSVALLWEKKKEIYQYL